MTVMRPLLVLVAAALVAQASVAKAADLPGTYVVSSCALGDQPIPLTGWLSSDPGRQFAVNYCGRVAGYFYVDTGDQESWATDEAHGWWWDAPKDVAIAGLRAWGWASSSDGIGAGIFAGEHWGSISSARTLPVEDLNLNSTRLQVLLRCADPEGCLARDAPPASPFIKLSRLEILLRDLLPPEAVGAPSGSLFDHEPLSGTVTAGTAYRDRG